MALKVVKLAPQRVRVGEDVFLEGEDREFVRYTEGTRWALIPCVDFYDRPIPSWMRISWWGFFFTWYIYLNMAHRFLVSEVKEWASTKEPVTEEERERMRGNVRLAAGKFVRRFEVG